MQTIKISKSMLAIVFIIIALIMAMSLYSSYIAQKNAVLELLVHSSIQLSKTIEKAAKNTLLSTNLYSRKILKKLYSDLNFIHLLDETGQINSDTLNDLLKKLHLNSIFIIGPDKRIELSTMDDKPPLFPLQDLSDLTEKKTAKFDFGILFNHNNQTKERAVGIARERGGAIIITEKAQHLLSVQNILNVNELLSQIATDSTIKYIAFQDTGSNIIYTTTQDSLSSIPEDKMLAEVINNNTFAWRIAQYQDQFIIETINHTFSLPRFKGIIRIGLDYSPIQKIQSDALKQASVRLVLLALLGFIMIAYSITIQNNQLLEIESRRVTREITQLQQHLTQKEKLSALGELAAGVAHKIRNPLNAISMTIQRLSSEFEVKKDKEEFFKLNTIVKKEIRQISEIINQFLQFSRPEPICKVPCSINEIIGSVLDLYAIKTSGNNIRTTFQSNEEVMVNIDDDKIKQSLINLIENAIDAIGKDGEIILKLQTTQEKIILTVTDTGMGISKENLGKIYNLYFTTKPNGTGIGLAQVYRVIAEHNGEITVDSQPGEGTCFTITLPRKEMKG
ncbi:MAG: GHKL domain-containing protein [Candidatus Marinimicrobia bacterium]|nr:GHKL domain-containing protein [Candidatus Neomarinimicrobiota bacterium]